MLLRQTLIVLGSFGMFYLKHDWKTKPCQVAPGSTELCHAFREHPGVFSSLPNPSQLISFLHYTTPRVIPNLPPQSCPHCSGFTVRELTPHRMKRNSVCLSTTRKNTWMLHSGNSGTEAKTFPESFPRDSPKTQPQNRPSIPKAPRSFYQR